MSQRIQSFGVPGMPCPECAHPIIIQPLVLLSAAPISCDSCGLQLEVNVQESAETLNALQSYIEEFSTIAGGLDEPIPESRRTRGGRPRTGRR